MNTSRFPVPASTLAFFQADYLFSDANMVKPWANGGKALELGVQAQVPWLWKDGQSIQIGLGGALYDIRNNIPLYFGAEVMTYPGVGSEGVGFDGAVDYLSLRYATGTTMNTNTAIGVTTTAAFTGWRQYTYQITAANLQNAIQKVNVARLIRGAKLMSTDITDYALSEIVFSDEAAYPGPAGSHIVSGCSFKNFQAWVRT
jgi:hypothetical protein